MALNDYLTRKQASAYLHSIGCPVAPSTLANMKSKRTGPPFNKVLGKRTYYAKMDLDKWAAKVVERIE